MDINLNQIILAVIAIFAGIAITIKIVKNNNSRKNSGKDNSNNVTITGNKAGGDIAGRDINKNK